MSQRILNLVTSAKDVPEAGRWKISINGEQKKWDKIDQIDLINDHPKVNLHFRYGKSPGGNYAQVIFEKGGGSSTAVVCEHSTEGVLIGILGQQRPLIYPDSPDKVVHTLPGGFVGKGESAEKAAQRELKEEAGFMTKPRKCASSHTHMDRALLVYSTNDIFDEFFYVKVKEGALKGPDRGKMHDRVWKLDQTLTPNPSPDEKIVADLEFVSAAWLLDNAVDAYTQLGAFKALRTLSRINFA